jgi:MarR-like DNA-binding transcriptional regulator SgrR of sgrS sRNA
VQDAAAASLEGTGSFRQALAHSGRLSEEELTAYFDYGPYLTHVEAIFARVGIALPAEVTR